MDTNEADPDDLRDAKIFDEMVADAAELAHG